MITVKYEKLNIPKVERRIGAADDTNVQSRVFSLPLSDYGNLSALLFKLDIQNAVGEKGIVDLRKTVDAEETQSILLLWEITGGHTVVPGTLFGQLRAFDEAGTMRWHSDIAEFVVEDSIEATEYIGDRDLSGFEEIERRITAQLENLNNLVSQSSGNLAQVQELKKQVEDVLEAAKKLNAEIAQQALDKSNQTAQELVKVQGNLESAIKNLGDSLELYVRSADVEAMIRATIGEIKLEVSKDEIEAMIRAEIGKIEISVTKEEVETMIRESVGNLEMYVKSDELIAKINMSPVKIAMSAVDIDLSGYVTFTTYNDAIQSILNSYDELVKVTGDTDTALRMLETGLVNGTTTIHGGCITTDSLSAAAIKTRGIGGFLITDQEMTSGTDENRTYNFLRLSSVKTYRKELDAAAIDLGAYHNTDGTIDTLVHLRGDGYVRFGLKAADNDAGSLKFNYSKSDNDTLGRAIEYLVYNKNFSIDKDGNVTINAKNLQANGVDVTGTKNLTAITFEDASFTATYGTDSVTYDIETDAGGKWTGLVDSVNGVRIDISDLTTGG